MPPPAVASDGPRAGQAASLRAVALVEAAKGALVLLAGFGLLTLVHHDLGRTAEQLVRHLHLNPASHLPRVFIAAASEATGSREMLLAAGAALYAGVRLVEAWGLWFHRRWAEWFAAASGAIYVPFEVRELILRPGWLSALLLAANLAVVAVLVRALWRKGR